MLRAIFGLFANAVGAFILGFFGLIVLFYGLGLLISVGIGLIVLIALNPLLWIFIVFIVGGYLLIIK